jgi:thiosulfate/3-mercaptopyruvate sulfurtransferase
MSEILVSVEQLRRFLEQGRCVLVDCRFDLARPGQSRLDFEQGHIPGAVYAHLDEHLASEITAQSGRHPLPDKDLFAAFLASVGWASDKRVVAYDAGNGAFAARLWWLMRFFGLDCALLDGGLAAWKNAGLPLERGIQRVMPGATPDLRENSAMTVEAGEILAAGTRLTLIDARAPERYSGETEPLDSKAGHIPGALNRPFASNLDAAGRFKHPDQLRSEFQALLNHVDPSSVVHYCGSGVTACHNAFAMALAGIEGSKVYPGSWSEWIRDPARPVEVSG